MSFHFKQTQASFFAVFDSLIAITTHPGAQNSRSGRFRVNDDDKDNRRTKRLLNPSLCMSAQGNEYEGRRGINGVLLWCYGPMNDNSDGIESQPQSASHKR